MFLIVHQNKLVGWLVGWFEGFGEFDSWFVGFVFLFILIEVDNSRSLLYKQIYNGKTTPSFASMTSFLVIDLCNSAAPKNGIYKLQHDKYCLGNEEKIHNGNIQRSSGTFLDFQKLTAEGHRQCNLTLKLPLWVTAPMLANTPQEKGR